MLFRAPLRISRQPQVRPNRERPPREPRRQHLQPQVRPNRERPLREPRRPSPRQPRLQCTHRRQPQMRIPVECSPAHPVAGGACAAVVRFRFCSVPLLPSVAPSDCRPSVEASATPGPSGPARSRVPPPTDSRWTRARLRTRYRCACAHVQRVRTPTCAGAPAERRIQRAFSKAARLGAPTFGTTAIAGAFVARMPRSDSRARTPRSHSRARTHRFHSPSGHPASIRLGHGMYLRGSSFASQLVRIAARAVQLHRQTNRPWAGGHIGRPTEDSVARIVDDAHPRGGTLCRVGVEWSCVSCVLSPGRGASRGGDGEGIRRGGTDGGPLWTSLSFVDTSSEET